MKNKYFQFLRGILIIFVVFTHIIFENSSEKINCINIILRTIINCEVPLFIFISAFFTDKDKVRKNPKAYIEKRFKRIVIPLLIFNALYGLFNFIGNGNLKKIFFQLIIFNTSGQLYYIVILFILSLLTPILIKLLENKVSKIILYSITPIYLLIIFILKVFYQISIPYYLYIVFGWLIYYLIGLEKDKYNANENSIMVIVAVSIATIGNLLVYKININNYNYAISQINILNMIYVIALIPVLLRYNNTYQSNKITSFVEKIGDYSFGIFFIHMFVIRIMNCFIIKENINLVVYYIFGTIITVIFSYLVIWIFKRITKNKFDNYLGF